MQGLVLKPWWTNRGHLRKIPKKWSSSYIHSVRFWNTIVRKYKQSLKLFSLVLSESKTIDDITLVVHFRFVEPTKINSFPLSGPAGSLVCQWAVTIAVQGWAWPVNCCWQEENMLTATGTSQNTDLHFTLPSKDTQSKAIFKTQGVIRGKPAVGATPIFIAQVPKGLSWLQPTMSPRDCL